MDNATASPTREDTNRAIDPLLLWDALSFAAGAHANQRRKGAAQEPHVNDLIEVADLVLTAAQIPGAALPIDGGSTAR